MRREVAAIRRERAGPPSKRDPAAIGCSFCGKLQANVSKIIAGPHGAYICNECISLCSDIMAEDLKPPQGAKPAVSEWSLLSALRTQREQLQGLADQLSQIVERAEDEATATDPTTEE